LKRTILWLGLLFCVLFLTSCSSGGESDGLQLAKDKGCLACHSTDGSKSVGPTWQGLYGATVELEDGSTVTADEAYLKEALENPGAQRVKGFTAVAMPPYQLSPDDTEAILALLQSLK
jgi:cytochrome c oxidase subunit II